MFSNSPVWRQSRKWLSSRLDPTSYFLLRHPDRYLDLSQLARGLREVFPHPRLYFMIVLPGSLHIARLACQFVPADVRLVAILTGVDSWEEAWARAQLKPAWILKTRFKYRHHEILNLLLREIHQPFGITDYDCFVFRSDYLRAIERIDSRTSAQVFFANRNDVLDFWVPETFLLGLNQPVLAELMRRYRVGANQIQWDDLSTAAQARLAMLGIGPDQRPETHKPAIDTLRALLTLAVADGYPYEFVARHTVQKYLADDVFHIGASAIPRQILENGDPAPWGSYFWIRRLEQIDDPALRSRYLEQFGFGSSEYVLSRFADRPNPEILKFVDNLAAGIVP
jgi:hypothetical protein